MKTLKAIITDDEQAARNVLFQLLQLEYNSIEVIAQCKDVPETVEAIKKHQPDVLFLDIQMPNFAGYEIVNFFDELNFEIIFVTAYDQYAIKAFELNAVDYIVKPINRQRLTQAIEKVQSKIEAKKTIEQYHLLKQALKTKSLEHIVIAELGKQHIIRLEEIIALEACGAYTILHLNGKDNLTAAKNIKQFETLLPDDGSFFRSHKSWIVHKQHIQRYAKLKLELQLTGGLTAKLSRYKKEEFESLL